jgi:hypothetical protein
MRPPVSDIHWTDTCRLIPSRYPSQGILDRVSSPEDLAVVFELEGWTNDRISAEAGILHRIPQEEWVMGRPMASVVMAAFCHSKPGGGRFNGPNRGAWYTGRSLQTAHAEAVFHRTAELEEIGVLETLVQVRLYLADFEGGFHDVRPDLPEHAPLHNPVDYGPAQSLADDLLSSGSNGVLYRSVRDTHGECLACFRPQLVANVRAGSHFEYHWEGKRIPRIRRL